ncbi:unnamed protein product [Mycetohabitans rhizoxinica HKI 454]|uniref:Uncharacterized protein n=1 Tax=Mycetohabitans rhizoxinica (strain DSM 19002 / CIP 109453 / HKI 454) TaxID=882378 RepID=E5ANF3_MYCRK|nr:unnamed protein product [Mycetohabitans rhizoxinica HKI 454]
MRRPPLAWVVSVVGVNRLALLSRLTSLHRLALPGGLMSLHRLALSGRPTSASPPGVAWLLDVGSTAWRCLAA